MIGFVIAMQKEAQVLLDQMENKQEFTLLGKQFYLGQAHGKDVVLAIAGIGKVNAAAAAMALLSRYAVTAVVNFGLAGAVNHRCSVGSVYAISQSVEYDFDLAQLNGTPVGTLDEYAEPYLPLTKALLFESRKLATGDRFNDSKADHILISETLGADIRDMEGGAIIHVAHQAGVPVYAFKAITDIAGSGSTTEQYLVNTSIALRSLTEAMPAIVAAV